MYMVQTARQMLDCAEGIFVLQPRRHTSLQEQVQDVLLQILSSPPSQVGISMLATLQSVCACPAWTTCMMGKHPALMA